MSKLSGRGWLFALFLIFIFAVVHIHGIHTSYMRDDEEIAFRTTNNDLGYTIWYQAYQDVHAPLWFSSFWLWRQFMGSTEFIARVYSIFLSLLTLALVYRLSRRWLHSAWVGWAAIAVLGANAYFYIYTQEIRPYALNMLVATLSMSLFYRWLQQRTYRAALLYGLTVAWMLYQHYFLMFLVMAQALYLLLVHRPDRHLLRQIIAAWALAFVLWLPWFPIFINQIKTLIEIESEFGNARGVAGIGSTTEPTTLDAVRRLFNLMTSGQPVLYLIGIALGWYYAWRTSTYRLLLFWAFAVPALALLINLVFSVYTPRYITYLIIGFALLIGVGLSHLSHRFRFIALVAFVGISFWSLPSQFPVKRIAYRPLFQQLAAASRLGDIMLMERANLTDNVVLWQLANYLPPYLYTTYTDQLAEALPSRRVWFVTGDWFNEQVRADFEQLEQSHPLQQVIGDCNVRWCYLIQLMEAPPLQTPHTFGQVLPFWGIDLDTLTPQSLQARLWWRTEVPPPQDYSIGLHLLNAAGELVAQSDGVIQHYATTQVNTSAMQPGQIYIDHRSLTLPPALPSGDYQLVLVVYDWQTGERLLLEDGLDYLLLQTITLPITAQN